MEQFKSIEEKLAQLVPPALSDEGQRKLEDMIDDLSGVDPDLEKSNAARFLKGWVWNAAAVLALSTSIIFIRSSFIDEEHIELLTHADHIAHSPLAEMVVLSSTKLIGGRENDGLIVPIDGTTPHYRYRYHVIDQEQVKDPDSGLVITLRQPRQEVLTIPITQF
jgi:hypothetical protein